MGRKKEMTRQTTIWFNDEDWALIDFVQEQHGLRTRADAIRLAIRQAARSLQPKRRRTPQEPAL